jgi:CRISPR-associated protein Cas2
MKAKRIFCVVAYDVSDDKRRSRVVKILEKYGVRANYSVFECMFTESQYLKVQQMLGDKIDDREDMVIYYPVCVNCFTKIVYQPSRKKQSIRSIFTKNRCNIAENTCEDFKKSQFVDYQYKSIFYSFFVGSKKFAKVVF